MSQYQTVRCSYCGQIPSLNEVDGRPILACKHEEVPLDQVDVVGELEQIGDWEVEA